jgi:hypothetical protein
LQQHRAFEAAGQKGYQTGGEVGAGLVDRAGLATAAAPLIEAIGSHLSTIKSIIDTASKIGGWNNGAQRGA